MTVAIQISITGATKLMEQASGVLEDNRRVDAVHASITIAVSVVDGRCRRRNTSRPGRKGRRVGERWRVVWRHNACRRIGGRRDVRGSFSWGNVRWRVRRCVCRRGRRVRGRIRGRECRGGAGAGASDLVRAQAAWKPGREVFRVDGRDGHRDDAKEQECSGYSSKWQSLRPFTFIVDNYGGFVA